MNNLDKKIKKLRKKAGITQVELAERVGVGLRFIRDLEQGKPTVRLDKVNQVLEFFGCYLTVKKDGKEI
jgi:y4mF family transcriptional regulator